MAKKGDWVLTHNIIRRSSARRRYRKIRTACRLKCG